MPDTSAVPSTPASPTYPPHIFAPQPAAIRQQLCSPPRPGLLTAIACHLPAALVSLAGLIVGSRGIDVHFRDPSSQDNERLFPPLASSQTPFEGRLDLIRMLLHCNDYSFAGYGRSILEIFLYNTDSDDIRLYSIEFLRVLIRGAARLPRSPASCGSMCCLCARPRPGSPVPDHLEESLPSSVRGSDLTPFSSGPVSLVTWAVRHLMASLSDTSPRVVAAALNVLAEAVCCTTDILGPALMCSSCAGTKSDGGPLFERASVSAVAAATILRIGLCHMDPMFSEDEVVASLAGRPPLSEPAERLLLALLATPAGVAWLTRHPRWLNQYLCRWEDELAEEFALSTERAISSALSSPGCDNCLRQQSMLLQPDADVESSSEVGSRSSPSPSGQHGATLAASLGDLPRHGPPTPGPSFSPGTHLSLGLAAWLKSRDVHCGAWRGFICDSSPGRVIHGHMPVGRSRVVASCRSPAAAAAVGPGGAEPGTQAFQTVCLCFCNCECTRVWTGPEAGPECANNPPSVILGIHLFGVLSRTRAGCAFLEQSPLFRRYIDVLREGAYTTSAAAGQAGPESDPSCACLAASISFQDRLEMARQEMLFKTALWSVAHLFISTAGVRLLLRHNIPNMLLNIAEGVHPGPGGALLASTEVPTLRGSVFYALGLASQTHLGRSLLATRHWSVAGASAPISSMKFLTATYSPRDFGAAVGVVPASVAKFLRHFDNSSLSRCIPTVASSPWPLDSSARLALRQVTRLANGVVVMAASRELHRLKAQGPEVFARADFARAALGLLEVQGSRYRASARRLVIIDLLEQAWSSPEAWRRFFQECDRVAGLLPKAGLGSTCVRSTVAEDAPAPGCCGECGAGAPGPDPCPRCNATTAGSSRQGAGLSGLGSEGLWSEWLASLATAQEAGPPTSAGSSATASAGSLESNTKRLPAGTRVKPDIGPRGTSSTQAPRAANHQAASLGSADATPTSSPSSDSRTPPDSPATLLSSHRPRGMSPGKGARPGVSSVAAAGQPPAASVPRGPPSDTDSGADGALSPRIVLRGFCMPVMPLPKDPTP
ncbi:hypothetical protein H696_06179 [Fonticula alba]|uniref:Rapamycin-insensitive companion of mTOR domain-containing protein n=1 Tax=Fonticula alba TaxID=691883 RepID=A0A058YZJ3_FONAL|nr:hypothetical protein H696_06179 [Fonticula alba]KCV67399.1 hypothetical protein H696_06179 [Fonticula alba]|eukprot:XP_009498197.1 hypothetical protein H696_06179 [Fonticula alba]